MQVITDDFRNAMMSTLTSMPEGTYLPAKLLCAKIGVDERYVSVITLLMQDPEFADKFESIKSKGIRSKKIA